MRYDAARGLPAQQKIHVHPSIRSYLWTVSRPWCDASCCWASSSSIFSLKTHACCWPAVDDSMHVETTVYLWNWMLLNVLDKCTIHNSSLHWFHFQLWLALGNKNHQNLLAEDTNCKLVFHIDVQLPKIQTITKYQHGLLMSNDNWPDIQVPWDPGGHHLNIVWFSTSVWVWDPGDLEHICLLFLKRLGDKPCFKEGRMSWTYWAIVWTGREHGPSTTWAESLSLCQTKESRYYAYRGETRPRTRRRASARGESLTRFTFPSLLPSSPIYLKAVSRTF